MIVENIVALYGKAEINNGKLLSEDHQLSAVKLAEKIGIVSRNIENNIKKLKEYGILIGHGSPKNGYWEIIDKDLQE